MSQYMSLELSVGLLPAVLQSWCLTPVLVWLLCGPPCASRPHLDQLLLSPDKVAGPVEHRLSLKFSSDVNITNLVHISICASNGNMRIA